MTTAIENGRLEMAAKELADYTFDECMEPVEVNGWELQSDEDKVSCVLFFPETADVDDGHTVLGQFTVDFEAGSSNVISSYATIDGNDTGLRVSLEEHSAPAPGQFR